MRRNLIPAVDRSGSLSIGELAERTGVPQATLRTWESRYGFPSPQRLAGGHRRYAAADVALVQEVARRRSSGQSVASAIRQASAYDPADLTRAEPSVFAGLRRTYPQLTPQALRKSTLLALTRAIEDECCARAERPVLFASFQRQRFYRQSRPRWDELARTARAVVVFADFPSSSARDATPFEVAVPADAPLRREWVLVCDAPDYPACVTAWEHPGQGSTTDANRRFEVLWTVDPRAVRDAANICVSLADTFTGGRCPPLSDLLVGTPAPPSADLRRAAGLLNRTIGYLERAPRA